MANRPVDWSARLRSWQEVAPILELARRTRDEYAALASPFHRELVGVADGFIDLVEKVYREEELTTSLDLDTAQLVVDWLYQFSDGNHLAERMRHYVRWSRRVSWDTVRFEITSKYRFGSTKPFQPKDIRYILTNWRRVEGDITGDAPAWEDREAILCFREDVEYVVSTLTEYQQEIANMVRYFPLCLGKRPNLQLIADQLGLVILNDPEAVEAWGVKDPPSKQSIYSELRRICRLIADYLNLSNEEVA